MKQEGKFSNNRVPAPGYLHFLIVFILVIGCLVVQVPCSGQAWQWAKGYGDTSGGFYSDKASSVTTSSDGYIYVTGQFESPALTIGGTTFLNAAPSFSDIFLIKYDAAGNVKWARTAGGDLSDVANSVTTDLSGNVYVTGNFESPTITFGSFTLTNSGDFHVFLVKYDSSGNVVWARAAGGIDSTDYDEAESVVTDFSGNVYVTGLFRSPTIVFDAITLIDSGNDDIFLAKYDASGNILWAKRAGGSGYDYAMSVSADPSGSVYITGFFQSPVITFGATTLTNTGSIGNVFVAKYSASGTVTWAKKADGSTASVAYAAKAGTDGSLYIAGCFSSPTLSFGSITVANASGAMEKNNIWH